MSDVISRIAARAVGAPALAQPQVAAPLAGEGGLEVVDEEVVVPGAAPAPAVAEAPAAPVADDAVIPAAPVEQAPEPLASIEVPPAAASPGPAAEEPRRHERSLPAHERSSVDPTEVEGRLPTAEPRAVASAVPVQAVSGADTLAATALPAERWATPAHVYTGPTEPPPVRVHIGRLEVRANLQEQPRPAAPPLPQSAEEEGLSLSDYLRGRR